MQTKNLTRTSIKAGTWIGSYNAIGRVVGLGKTAILARILSPAQFGLFGVVYLALTLLETFSETGVEMALIHKKNAKPVDYSTAWAVSLLRGFIIGAILFLSAPLVARFFTTSNAASFIRVIALVPIIKGFKNPNSINFKKHLKFDKEFYLLISGFSVETITALGITLITHNIWGLVLGILAGSLTEVIVSFTLADFPKLITPKLTSFKKLINFGRWVWSASSLSYLVNQGDDIIVGKLLGTASLGLYQNAFKIASLPATQITGVVSYVTFPAFSSIQEDPLRLKRAFKKTFILTTILTSVMSLLIILLARPITLIVFGPNWLGMVPALRILGIFGAIRASTSTLEPLANALGKPYLITSAHVIRAILLFTLIIPLTQARGIVGTALATVFAITISSIFLFLTLKRSIR